MNDNYCPTCGKPWSGTKTFEGYMANLLGLCIKISADDTVSEEKIPNLVRARQLRDMGYTTQYNRISDLCYWGLLSRRDEWWHYGLYQLTDKAIKFIRNQTRIPQAVEVSQGKVLKFSEKTISFREAAGKRWNQIEDWINDWHVRLSDNFTQTELPLGI